ncbi:hypothetical protein GCM10027597_10160 [Saccharopolyspora tripterygii]
MAVHATDDIARVRHAAVSPSFSSGDPGAGTGGHNNDEAAGGAGSYQVTSVRTGRLKRLIRYGTGAGPTRP